MKPSKPFTDWDSLAWEAHIGKGPAFLGVGGHGAGGDMGHGGGGGGGGNIGGEHGGGGTWMSCDTLLSIRWMEDILHHSGCKSNAEKFWGLGIQGDARVPQS